VVGHPIHPVAERVLTQLGGDASDFAARQLTARIASGADLVLTMTTEHRDDVLKLVPQQLHRTFTLREAARLASEGDARNIEDLASIRPRFPSHGQSDIADPLGHDEAFFSSVGTEIADLLPPILDLCRSC
jgi:protein-tyrosine phosphatase